MMSNTLLSNEIDKFNTLGKDIIDSLNGDGCIVKKGYAKSTISWFIIKLYSLYSDTEITLHKLLQPKESYPYDNVLRKWDTPDVNEVSKYIEILCDAHLVQAKLDYEIYEREEEEGEVYHLKYKELFSLSSYLYPFEILVWLKLREQAGLENPTEFTHPLMNTPIAKMFLELKEPLEKPQHLPYADELIAKLKEQCPDMDKESVENKSSQQATTQPKLVPKTGHYQATLPKEHPQAEALKADPQAYFTYNEGEHFSLAGLETLDALKRATSKTEDGKHMQLVPTKIHEQFSHTGGASYAKNGV